MSDLTRIGDAEMGSGGGENTGSGSLGTGDGGGISFCFFGESHVS